jgi:hypothetical protein
LSNVPVSLEKLEGMLKEKYDCSLAELVTRAEFVNPDMRLFLLDEFTEQEEADAITERMSLPYPLICLSGQAISKDFYKKAKYNFGGLICPDERDLTAKVLSRKGVGGAAVIFEKGKKLEYIEIVLAKEFG